eukprot:PhM_4_TR4330/c0_g2_i1/m.73647
MDGSVTREVLLSAIPATMGVIYTDDDVDDVLTSVCDRHCPGNKVPVSGRVRHAMATKACRRSIMIGTALDMRTMREVVARLAWLEQPWNCPHGRPTIRRISSLANLNL